MKISKKTFEKEIAMCKKLAQQNNKKCAWGECDKCGVIPLLHKLRTGKFIEDKKEVQSLKNKTL